MKKKNIIKIAAFSILGLATSTLFQACTVKVPSYAEPVKFFNAKQYGGKWYEIARFDFKYEKDMSNVTAEYSVNYDGTIKVVNRGYDYIKNEWKEKVGKAKYNGSINEGALKVSFFGPFYGGYNVVAMEPDYQTALVFGDSTDYIWILSRTKTIPEATKQKFLAKAKDAGYDLERLVWTEHDKE